MDINNYIDIVAYIILPIIGSMFIVYACFDFMKKVNRNIYRSKIIYVMAFVLLNVFLLLAVFSGSMIINIVTFLVGILLIGHFLYNDSKLYLLYYCLFAICLLFVDLLVGWLLSLAITYGGFYFSSLAYLQITVIFLVRIIEYIYIKLFTNFINRREAKVINRLQSFTFLVIPLFSVIYIHTLVYLLQLYVGLEESILLVVNIVLVLILNIYVTHIFDAVSKNNALENEVNLYQQQSELQHKYYNNLENKYKESRKLIHDIRNHIQSIERLYENKEENLAKKYTDDVHVMLNELNQKYYTSNRILNIILNDKYQIIKSNNIDFDCKIGDINLSFMKEIDITTIFANLLDNAIEAAKKIDNNSYIKLHINNFNDFIVVNIINSMRDKPIMKNEKFKSTKVGHEALGIENIRKTLNKYDGNLVIEFDNHEFKVNIIIPN